METPLGMFLEKRKLNVLKSLKNPFGCPWHYTILGHPLIKKQTNLVSQTLKFSRPYKRLF